MLPEKLTQPYKPSKTEDRIYRLWEESGFFNPDNLPARHKKPYSIVLPPPNVTGNLHMGHAAMLAVEDILIRYHRMYGKKTLWLPGTDHAAIATQAKVEKQIYNKEKKTRHDLGRKAFLSRVEQFSKESHNTIVRQLKKMGSSLDWSREAYTLDEERSRAVRTAFKEMYDAGLIYRGSRIVNWDPKMQTTVSDDEVEWVEQKTPFYYLKYGPFTIGTARPETKFGDKYVVMHPRDKRYKDYKHGDTIELEWINGPITATIIKDEAIDMEFGTGVMTITPWHDTADFEIAERHKLDKEQIIDKTGKLLPIAGEFAGQHIKKARALIAQKLKEKNLLIEVDENYTNRVATNSRGGGILEPQIMKQWFVDVTKKFKPTNKKAGKETTLKELMRKAVEDGDIKIVPKQFEKIYYHWIENLRDWCISRQIWYGHRIPVYYCKNQTQKCRESLVSIEEIEKCPHCEGGVEQDTDTLDTWFSSGLWTFSTLGWPFNYARGKPIPGSDLELYHPTDVLETGYDILFFWIARMILMSEFLLGEKPFETVYLHGLVRDEKERKMSKSLGNVIDPLDMIERYGADATRLSLVVGAPPGSDIKLSEDKVRGYKHFANKLWNITRFVLENTEDFDASQKPKLTDNDEKILQELNDHIKKITEFIETYRLYLAAEHLYHYTWHTLADKIIEESKSILNGEDAAARKSRQRLLFEILTTELKLLHPFIPFVTEEIWSVLPDTNKTEKLLMIEHWPLN